MDSVNIPQSWVNGLGAALVTLWLWIMRKYASRIESLVKAQSTFVTREELNVALDKRDQDLKSMHQQNIDNFRELREQFGSVNAKLFELAKQKQP